MVLYEFYIKDGSNEPELVGILPERRKNKRRVTRKSIMKWGKIVAGSHVDPNSIYYVKLNV
jgi:hypothetical protein